MDTRSYPLLYFLIVLMGTGVPLVAQAQQRYQFENLTTADGLSDNRITCITKDATGFVWVGTENGLNRYDGHSFLWYNTGIGKRDISNPYINDVEQDADGSLWVATQSGLNVINTVSDSIFIFSADASKKEERLPSDLIWDVWIDKTNKVWLAADVKDLCYYDVQTKKFTYFPWKQFAVALFPQLQHSYLTIRKIYKKSDDELWLGTSVGLFSFSMSTGTFRYYSSKNVDHFIQLESSPDGKTVYFVQNPYPKLEILSVADNARKDLAWDEIPLTKYLPGDARQVGDLKWLPAGNDILEINTTTQEAIRIQHITDNPYSLLPGNVRTVYQDDEGLVWVGTSGGLSRFNPARTPFLFTEVISPSPPGDVTENDLYRLNHPVHTVFYSQTDDKYYISSPATNRLIIKDRATGKSKVLTEILGKPLKKCSVIFEDSKGRLWILALPHAFILDRRTQQFALSSFQSQSSNILFTDMAEDGQGNYWFACLNDGLYRYNEHDRSQKKLANAQFNSSLPTCLYFDKDLNKLWIGTFDHGLFVCDLKDERFTRFPVSKKVQGFMPSALITDVVKDKANTIWIATYAGGIARCASTNTDRTKFTQITASEGLPENNVFSLLADRSGAIWTTSYHGISRISPDGAIENFDRSKGLGLINFYSPFTMTSDGEILTGAGNGFIRFHPDRVRYQSPPFPVAITSISINDTAVKRNFATGGLQLAHTSNDVEFRFAALAYGNPSGTVYEYALDGMHKNWIAGDHTNHVRYNNLPPGHYTFKVKARDFTGVYSSNEASVSFDILPPWWATGWFRLLCGICLASAIVFVFRVRITNVRKKAAVQQQMAELKSQALRSQMNPHFIFNSLNAIQELIVSENYTAAYQYLSKFSRLLRMVLDSSEKNFIPLSNEIEICQLYVELESLRFQHSFHYSIDAGQTDADVTLFPTLLVQPFVENAIWHGLMQKEGDKILSVKFEEKGHTISCTIKDNGIGMKRAAEIKAGKIGSSHFTSKGIPLALQRVEALKASGNHHAEIKITDGKDEEGNAVGTKVEINISYTNAKTR
ncbi:ligand-binding sensor domain-containing protein [Chryseolinea soli]|uniref:ligand-binding sensor domain-containing protein n=1 Tax=Chryseolinea soli TaxID=2321403 RepID=UPI00135678A7|nr:two-component regulator propeller domain-containing protein [Chryseolinea soli]